MKTTLSVLAVLLCSNLAAQRSIGVACEGGDGRFSAVSYPASSFIATPSTGETVTLQNGVPNAVAVLLIGRHPQQTTNIDLGTIGLPGCFLYTTPFRTMGTVLSPTGEGVINLPSLPTGQEFLFQWAYLDENAPRGLKVTTSDALVAGMPQTLSAFRISRMALADPHVFAFILFACLDVTSIVFNAVIDDAITTDGDGDNLLDLNLMFLFRPLDPGASEGVIDFILPNCTAPIATTSCALAGAPYARLRYTNSQVDCLGTIPGTTNWAVSTPSGPCFVTEPFSLNLDLNGLQVPLEGAQIAGGYVGSPPHTIANGLMRGFLPEAVADQIILPLDIPVVGGNPLSSILPGSASNCSSTQARDIGPNGTIGWWVYLNFEAEAVPVVQ